MKVALISDTHLGLTTKGQLKTMLKALVKEDFDVLVHAGDYCGGEVGHRQVRLTVELIRSFFPDKPFLSVIGNHDYWCRDGRPSMDSFNENLDKIKQTFKTHKVHFLDYDGVWSHPDFIDIAFVGSSGWYAHPNPPTNDANFLPIGIDGDTNRYLIKLAEDRLFANLDGIDKSLHNSVVFVSHFPVIKAHDYKGRFEDFSWRESLGNFLQEEHGIKFFFNGHAHQLHTGPLRYECGSDYFNPKYIIIHVY